MSAYYSDQQKMVEITVCDFLCVVIKGIATFFRLSEMSYTGEVMCEDTQTTLQRDPCGQEQSLPTTTSTTLSATCRSCHGEDPAPSVKPAD